MRASISITIPISIALAAVVSMLSGCGDDGPCDASTGSGCDDGKTCEVVQGTEDTTCAAPLVVEGRVFDLATDAPIAGARIVALDANNAAIGSIAVSDSSGRYSLGIPTPRNTDGTPATSFQLTLRADAAGYVTFPSGIRPALPFDTANPALADGRYGIASALTDIGLLPIAPGGPATGTIRGHVAENPDGASVLVVAEVGGVGHTAIADREGDFTIFNVPAGAAGIAAYALGHNYEPATADVVAGREVEVNLARSDAAASTVSGTVQIVNGQQGNATSVILVVESTFDAMLARGETPAGLRSPKPGDPPNVTGAFSIAGVPAGRYVVLAGFENDFLVRDESTPCWRDPRLSPSDLKPGPARKIGADAGEPQTTSPRDRHRGVRDVAPRCRGAHPHGTTMSMIALLENTLGTLLAMMHPPQPVADPPPEPSGVPGLSDEELAKLAEASATETIVVTSDAPAESASSVHLDGSKLRFRPRTQPSDILRQVPGLVVSQHAGGGKSDQYFIRGFDADHGTDIAIFADGIPVNLSSHGHGQGYADTHWMIPETLESVDVHKGPYAARYGDYYTAGALELKTIDKIDGPTVWVASGAPVGDSSVRLERLDRRLVGMASPRLRSNPDDRSLLALQIAENDGPFVHAQDFRQGNALAKWRGAIGPGELEVAGTWYRGSWNQSGQLPEGEVAAGRIDRFGAIDPTEGGDAMRASLQLGYTVRNAAKRSTLRVMGYGVRNELELYSNFTLFARDTVNGDQIGQTDDRMLYGADAAYERWLQAGPVQALLTIGTQLRYDSARTSLFHAASRERLEMCFGGKANPCNHTDNRILNAAAYAEADIVPHPRLHVRPGLRIDAFQWGVTDLDPGTAGDPMTTTGGQARAGIVSPKLSVELHESEQMTFFANGGYGFHSNDARAAVSTKGAGALAQAIGAEAGVRMKPAQRARLSADVWYLHLASEQVWSGDNGGTEPSDPTRRFGLDVEGSLEAASWLSLDANVTWAKSTLVANQGNGGALALAPRWMGSGGVSVHDKRSFVSLRTRGIADRPGNDDGSLTAKGYLLVDLIAGKKLGNLDLELTISNLLDTKWREAQFAEESRVAPGADLMEQMHFTPGMPLTATLKAAYKF